MCDLKYQRFCWQYKNVFEQIELDAAANILDMGCGDGNLVINFAKRFETVNVTGIDKYSDYKDSTERKANAESLISQFGLSERCTVVEANAFKLPFEENYFDLIHARNSLHHMFNSNDTAAARDIVAFFKKTKGLLKKNGVWVISEVGPVNYLSYAKFLIPKKLFFINQAHNMDYKSKFPLKTWVDCLKETGFNVIIAEYYVPYRMRYLKTILANDFFSRFSHSSFTILAQRND